MQFYYGNQMPLRVLDEANFGNTKKKNILLLSESLKRSRAKICRGIKGKNMDNTLIEKQLKAAADLNDIKLLECMKNGEVCVCDFVDVLGISQQR